MLDCRNSWYESWEGIQKRWRSTLPQSLLLALAVSIAYVAYCASHHRQDPAALTARFFIAWAVLSLIAITCQFSPRKIKLYDDRLAFGWGREWSKIRYARIARVEFAVAEQPPFMVIVLKNDKRAQLFLDPNQLPIGTIRAFLASHGIACGDAAPRAR